MNGHVAVVRALLSAGADGSIADGSGALPMEYAEFRGFDNVASMLLPHSVSANATPTSIFEAIDDGDLTAAPLLVATFSPNVNSNGTYPLHYALSQRQTEFVPLLLRAGADLSLRTSKGCQALAIAATKGLENAVRALLKAGADVNDQNPQSGFTPMHYAIGKGRLGVVQMLMAAGANVMLADRYGRTALDLALADTRKEVLAGMIGGGLLRKMTADALLLYAVQARRFGLALTAVLIGRKTFGRLYGLSGVGNAGQLRLLTERTPGLGLVFFRKMVDSPMAQNSWAVLDSL
jgi:ankyrin repeat protein